MVGDVAFLVTSSNSFPLPISIALDLSGLSFSQPELILVPISEGQSDSNDAAISWLVTWGAGGGSREKRGTRVGGHWLAFHTWYLEGPLPFLPSRLLLQKADNTIYFNVHLGVTFSTVTWRNKGRLCLNLLSSHPWGQPLRGSLMNWDLEDQRQMALLFWFSMI